MADEFSTRLRQARLDAGLSREYLAGKIGVSLATVVRYETGRTQRISLDLLSKIAQATDRPVVWFFEGNGTETREESHGSTT